MSLPYSHSPPDNEQGASRAYVHDHNTENIMMDCFISTNGLPNSQTNSNLINVGSVPKRPRVSQISHPEVSMRQFIDGNDMTAANCLMNGGFFSTGNQYPEVNMKFIPVRAEVAQHPMTKLGGEQKASGISRSQRSDPVSNLMSRTSALQHGQISGVKEINDRAKVSHIQVASSGKIDGSFLTLGTGANPETRSCSNFSIKEVANKLNEVSPQYNFHARQTARDTPTLTELAGRTAGFRTNAVGLSNSPCNMDGQISACSGCVQSTGPKSIPFHTFQALQSDINPNHSVYINRDSGFQVDMARALIPSQHAFMSHPECTRWPALTSESAYPSAFSNQSKVFQQQNYSTGSSMKVSSQSSNNLYHLQSQKSSITHTQLGKLVPLSKGHIVGRGSTATGVQPVVSFCTSSGGKQTISEESGSQVDNSCATCVKTVGLSSSQSVAGGLFPKRLGVQPNDLAARAAEGDLHHTQNPQVVHYPQRPSGPPVAMGPPQVCTPAGVNPCGVSVTSRDPNLLAQLSKDFRKAVCGKGQVIPAAKVEFQSQVSDILCQPTPKRRANGNPPAAPASQRRKIVPQPVIPHSVTQQLQHIPPIPAAPLHIRWQGFNKTVEPAGQNCHICKRDLSFSPEGPMHQPTISPPVAVLPCGHAFHDDCLQKITPVEELKNPPCIPCAIGES